MATSKTRASEIVKSAALQIQVASHAAHLSEEKVFEKLASEGIIPESALEEILTLVEREDRQL